MSNNSLIFNKDGDIYKFGELLKTIGDASGKTGDLIDGAKRLDDMAEAVRGLSTQEALLALTTKNVSQEDQKLILVKAGLVTETEAETVVTNGATVAKGENLTVTELLSAAYTKLAASIGISTTALTTFIGVVAGIAIAITVIEKIHVTAKEAQKAMEDAVETYKQTKTELESLNSELDETSNKIDELNSKKNLSIVEKEELKTLKETNKELETKIALKEKQAALENKDAAQSAATSAKKSFGKESTQEIADSYMKQFVYARSGMMLLQDYGSGNATSVNAGLIAAYQKYQELNNTEALSKVEGKLSDNLVLMQEQRDAMESYYNYLQSINKSSWTSKDNEVVEQYERIVEEMDLINRLLDPSSFKEQRISGILEKEDFKLFAEIIKDMGESGTLSIAKLNDKFPELIRYLNDAGVSAQELYQYIMNLSNPDAIDYSAVRKQMMNSIGLGNGVNSAEDAKIWNVIQNAGINNNDGLDAYLAVRAKYTEEETEYWTAEDWVSHIEDELNNANLDVEAEVSLDTTKAISSLKDLSDELDNVANALKTFYEEEKFSINDLDSIADYFLGLENVDDTILNSVNNALGILMDTTATSEQQADAIDILADSYLKTSTVLDTLTESNADLMKTQLRVMGIVNAEEIVDAKLAQTKAELFANNEKVVQSSINLSTVTKDEINALLVEQEITDITAKKIAELAFEKQFVNEVTIDTTADINNVYELAKAAGATAEQLRALANAKSILAAAEFDSSLKGYDSYKEALDLLESVSNGTFLENAENKVEIEIPKVDYEKSLEDLLGDGNGAKDTEDSIDWIEKLISRIQRTITNLGKTVSATYKQWSTRNNALAQEMQAVNQEIDIQQKAYEAYMAKANSIPLPEAYKELVRNGGFRIEDIADEDLREQISAFQEWYEKALDCSDAIEDLRANLAELAKTKFDNVSAQYDEQISLITHHVSMLEGFVSQSEAAGYMASEVYYQAMAEKQQENIDQLQGEYSSLLSTFDEAVKNGSIEKYSQDWYEMLSAINDVELELQSATTELIEFNQTLQQLSWEVFDKIQESVNGIVEEANFLIDVLDSKDLHTDKGVITDEGLAVQGLHAVNYNTYMEQALAYADEMAKIEEEMAKDPYDMELVERRNELLKLQQESISNAMSEKEAIRDLVSDGYDKMLSSLDELINKRKEALQAEKDMYDYQNSISEKTNNISNLKKQLQAYSGDNSESAKATIQKLQVSLADAEKDLQQTEYEKYLSDQEQMLNSLYDQTEQWVNERLDNLDGLVAEAVEATNKNAETISNAIHDLSNNYGYKISDTMETIWDYEENAIDGVCTIVSVYGDIMSDGNKTIADNITNGTTSVVNAISGLNSSMQTMISELKNIATANKESIAQAQNAVVSGQNNSYPTNNSASDYAISSSGGSSSGTGGSGGNAPSPKYEAKIGSYTVGRGYSSEAEARKAAEEEIEKRIQFAIREAIKGKGSESNAIAQNIRMGLSAQLTPQINIRAYAKGTTNAKRGLGIFGEAGDELLIANDGSILLSSGATLYPFKGGEQVIDAKKTAETLSNKLVPLSINDFSKVVPNMNGIVRNTNGNVTQDINVSFALPNVTDANSLITELQNNKRFEKVIQGMTADVMVGKNSLNKYKF